MKSKVNKLTERVDRLELDRIPDDDNVMLITLWFDEHDDVQSTREILTKEEHAKRFPDYKPGQPITVNWD